MTIIAFDVSKDELVGVRINKRAKALEQYRLSNTPEAIADLLKQAQSAHAHLTIASEATADYHRMLARITLDLGIAFRLINPILTKQFTRATIRKQKTDLTDAFIIAKLVLQGEGTPLTASALDPLKSINRLAFKVSRLHLMLAAMHQRIQRVFPEKQEVLVEIERPMHALSQAVKNLRRQISSQVEPGLKTLLLSIPGIGPTLAAALVTEIGDVSRFPNANALVAYAGLDPKVRQSGITLRRNTKLTKRGSPYLRKAAFIAAYIAKRYDPELKAYFEKKIREGKRYKEAVVAIARKILYRVYAVWKRGTPYVKKPLPLSEKELST